MSRRRRLRDIYVGVARTYRAWAPSMLLLATIVFVPIGFADALLHQIDAGALDIGGGFKLAAFLTGVAAIAASGLFGEVFFSGAVAISLTHPEHERPPSLLKIARQISYLKLIVVDLVYGVLIAIGTVVFFVPGVVILVLFALTGPVVELEKHTVRGGFARSFRLVRGHFWMVAAIVLPVEILGDFFNDLVVGLSHDVFGHGLVAAWIGESVSNIITTPIFGIAVVLLTLDLIHHHDGDGPRLKRRPAPIVPAATAGAAA